MKNINTIDFEQWEYDSDIQFYLYEKEGYEEARKTNGYVEDVFDTSLKEAISYFKDNCEGDFILEWFDDRLHQYEINL